MIRNTIEYGDDYGRAADVLARTLYGEARGEGLLGKEAVASVILNRVKRAKGYKKSYWWGNNIEQVCLKKWQFSCWNEDDPNREKILKVDAADPVFRQCLRIARRAVSGLLKDPTYGATHYHTVWLSPSWAMNEIPCVEIGNHVFYNNIA